MSNILLTIIIPCFNADNYIEETLHSIICQMKDSIEILIIDDGSTDNTSQKILQIQNHFKHNIFYYKQDNSGASSARNNAINYANGEYIWFVDSDDLIAEGAIDFVLEKISQNFPDLIHFNFSCLNGDEHKINKNQLIFDGKGQDFVNAALLQDKFSITTWSNIINLDFLKKSKVLFTEGIVVEDEEFYLKLFCLADKIVSFNNPLYIYRIREDSIAHSVNHIQKRTESKFIIFNNIQFFLFQNTCISDNTYDTVSTYLVFLILFDYCLIDSRSPEKKALKKQIKQMKLHKNMKSHLLKYRVFKIFYVICPDLLLNVLSEHLRRRS